MFYLSIGLPHGVDRVNLCITDIMKLCFRMFVPMSVRPLYARTLKYAHVVRTRDSPIKFKRVTIIGRKK